MTCSQCGNTDQQRSHFTMKAGTSDWLCDVCYRPSSMNIAGKTVHATGNEDTLYYRLGQQGIRGSQRDAIIEERDYNNAKFLKGYKGSAPTHKRNQRKILEKK